MLKKLWLTLFVGLFFLSANSIFAADAININTATQAQLETLNGVGPATATAIIEHRDQVGSFKTVDEITNVKGIGDKKLAKFADQIVVTESKKE
ncbi:MAG: competence protein ComEA [Methylophaga sp.]|nr:MAG: competence protein ComEA [Methylophaga sp.]